MNHGKRNNTDAKNSVNHSLNGALARSSSQVVPPDGIAILEGDLQK